MSQPRFLQIHFLTSYAATLLNRDDAGMAKRLPFGGATRTRVSSQCLKRHWRTAEDDHALKRISNIEMSLRSRLIFSNKVAEPLIKANPDRKQQVEAAVAAFQDEILGSSARAKKEKEEKKKGKDASDEQGSQEISLETNQVVILGQPEVRFIQEKVKEIVAETDNAKASEEAVKVLFKKERKNLKALIEATRLPAGLDAALFGRMVTSDLLTRLDAAIHVAHAFTVHAQELETDYFSAIDDLIQEAGELGSGHINDSELTSGLFYGYVVVDIPLLVENLASDRQTAAQVVENLLHLIATVSPGAKKGSTAPYGYAEMVLVESGRRQPRTLANAFRQPVPNRNSGDLRDAAITQLGTYLKKCDAMYGEGEMRKVATMGDASLLPVDGSLTLGELAKWSAAQVLESA
ncbi:MAG: type I-E CRISPR-associated protein Cas7/Cse4/CasC [Magnetococcales bacterium]|nr:type I-E CRISPR-associated protein Cas7/Cse4/CasC [Magnetococcales bacterium]